MSKPKVDNPKKWIDEARETEIGREVVKIQEIYTPYRSMMDISIEFLNQIKPKTTFSTSNSASTT